MTLMLYQEVMEMGNRDDLDSVMMTSGRTQTKSMETQTELTLPTQGATNLETQSFTFYLYKENKTL